MKGGEIVKFIELCNKPNKNGRRKFKTILYEIYPDTCISTDNLGTEYNDNGITWIEKYCEKSLDSIAGMSIRVQFIDEAKSQIYGHGETDLSGKHDGIPLFENATVVGHFIKGYITDIEQDGITKRVCIGEGTLDEMCYPNFVQMLEEKNTNGETVFGSIEIFRASNNLGIVYLGGHTGEDFGRIPVEFVHSGFALLDIVEPSDSTSRFLELNTKNKEEHFKMDEEMVSQFVDSIKNTIVETNAKNAEYEAKIAELNATIEGKDKEISELNACKTESEENAKKKEEEISELNATFEKAKAELNACKKDIKTSELNSKLADFSDEEKAFAKEDIEKFTADPVSCGVEINSIVTKIKAGVYDATQAKVVEINSKNKGLSVDSIFEGIDTLGDNEDSFNLDDICE